MMTIAVIIMIPFLLDWLEISRTFVPLFRVAAVAGVFHVLLLVLFVVLLYFDFRESVMWLSLLFFVSNTVFTWLTLEKLHLMGWGYLASAFVTTVAAFALLWNRLDNLEFVTFVQQPINQQKIVSR